jgi:hypothetical protein
MRGGVIATAAAPGTAITAAANAAVKAAIVGHFAPAGSGYICGSTPIGNINTDVVFDAFCGAHSLANPPAAPAAGAGNGAPLLATLIGGPHNLAAPPAARVATHGLYKASADNYYLVPIGKAGAACLPVVIG